MNNINKIVKKIIIDNGHGIGTLGKSSPDGRLKEYRWTRDVAAMLAAELRRRGFEVHLLVPETEDVPLRERVARVNAICRATEGGASACVLVSLHVNASGIMPQWRTPNGWSAYIGLNASTRSRKLADMLAENAGKRGLRVRRQYPDKGYWQQSFAMVRDTLCPAVLTENLFMDNESDCGFLLSAEGRKQIVGLHADALESYCRNAA